MLIDLAKYHGDQIRRLGLASMATGNKFPSFEGSFDGLVAQLSENIRIPRFHITYENYVLNLENPPGLHVSDLDESLSRLQLNMIISATSSEKL